MASWVNIAIGGRVGILYSTHTKINIEEMGDLVKIKRKEHYNLNRFRYGLTARVGIGRFNAYYFHALSPLFRGTEGPEQTQATHYKVGVSFAAFQVIETTLGICSFFISRVFRKNIYLISGNVKPNLVNPCCISSQDIKRSHSNPLLWFSIILTTGPWSMARYLAGYHSSVSLKAS
ncbi:hypothetical protein BH23BAC1_BH23BAC1_02000 [soil metagenome]